MAKLALLLIKIMQYGIVQFLLYEYLDKNSKLCKNTKHSLLIINLHEHIHRHIHLSNFLI